MLNILAKLRPMVQAVVGAVTLAKAPTAAVVVT
nr:MAG TPA: hypothetical protein [Caudoviricetes sp.]